MVSKITESKNISSSWGIVCYIRKIILLGSTTKQRLLTRPQRSRHFMGFEPLREMVRQSPDVPSWLWHACLLLMRMEARINSDDGADNVNDDTFGSARSAHQAQTMSIMTRLDPCSGTLPEPAHLRCAAAPRSGGSLAHTCSLLRTPQPLDPKQPEHDL